MPTDPSNPHVDTPHRKTVHRATDGWRYACHSSRCGDAPRGARSSYRAANGQYVTTEWKLLYCGHNTRGADLACADCTNLRENPK